VVAVGVEEALEVVGVGLAEVGAEAGGEGVAETDDEGLGGRRGLRVLRGALRGGCGRCGRGLRGGWNCGGRLRVLVCRLASAEEKARGEGGECDESDSG